MFGQGLHVLQDSSPVKMLLASLSHFSNIPQGWRSTQNIHCWIQQNIAILLDFPKVVGDGCDFTMMFNAACLPISNKHISRENMCDLWYRIHTHAQVGMTMLIVVPYVCRLPHGKWEDQKHYWGKKGTWVILQDRKPLL